MKIDGKSIADGIFEDLKKKVERLKKKGVTPHLVIVLVGDDPASAAYVRQKELKTDEVGAAHTTFHLPVTTSMDKLLKLVKKLNNDPKIHGVIVQRPLPSQIDPNAISLATNSEKDIDSFHPDSPFPMPLAAAVLMILAEVFCRIEPKEKNVEEWLKSKTITVIGKGQTGGGPTIEMFKKMGIEPQVIDSKTKDTKSKMINADIIISTVGKSNIVKADTIKKGVVLISVGLHKGEDGKLHGDYDEEEIKDIASFYTPTPKGVGPVNVAMLVQNFITAAEKIS